MREHWTLDPAVTFLNHGSFGACPRAVLDAQQALRAQLEREPVQFFVHELDGLLHAARAEVASFVGASPEDLVFVRNATSGVNAVLRSLSFEAGDELLTTDHAYNGCRNALEFVARRSSARVTVVPIPFPIESPEEIVERVVDSVTERTRLALLDHVTSPTGLVLPIASMVQRLADRGVDVLVDGAHGPGMVGLDLSALGAAYYAANFHKWVCAPKGAGMLWARPDKQESLHPPVISNGYNSPRPRKRFLEEFDWTGSDDPTPWLCVPEAIRDVASLGGGWAAVRARNRALALKARALLCDVLGLDPPAPETMIGSLAAVPLPPGDGRPPTSALGPGSLQQRLFDAHGIEVPVIAWPRPPSRLIRISAHLYNEEADYHRLARALRAELG